jgi:catalase
MRTDGNLGSTLTYWPNSHSEWTDQPQLNEPALEIDGAAAHWDHRVDEDHFQQPGDLFRKMTAHQRQILCENTARQVGQASPLVQQRHVANCTKADPAYGKGVADALVRFAAGKL